ncbi:MAG TPA: hypothetical protein VHG28_03245 [Longimicrobiaceae bacterium]|nr:hypothetical protein [Longimicrobiaceae bacterium]
MEETLRSCRRIYYAVLGLSAALIVLSLSTRRSLPFERAAQELHVLLSAKPERAPVLSCDSLARSRLGGLVARLEAEYPLARTNLDSAQAMPRLSEPLASVRWKSVTVSELLSRVDRNPGGSCSRLVAVDSSMRIARFLASGTGLPTRICEGCQAYFSISPTHASLGSDSALWALRFTVITNNAHTLTTWPLPETEVVDSGFGLLGLLRREPALRAVYRANGPSGEREWLPALRDVEESVGRLDLQRAQSKLRRLRDESMQTVSVFGVSINERLAAIAGPLLVLLALTYLHSHLEHLRRHVPGSESQVSSYPWVPLFPGATGRTSSLVAFLALPIGTIGLLLIRTLDWTSLLQVGVVAPISVLALRSAWKCVTVIESIRSGLRAGPAGNARPDRGASGDR